MGYDVAGVDVWIGMSDFGAGICMGWVVGWMV